MMAHLTETPGFSKKCSGVKILILDEADRLLDMGFKRSARGTWTDGLMSALNELMNERLTDAYIVWLIRRFMNRCTDNGETYWKRASANIAKPKICDTI